MLDYLSEQTYSTCSPGLAGALLKSSMGFLTLQCTLPSLFQREVKHLGMEGKSTVFHLSLLVMFH